MGHGYNYIHTCYHSCTVSTSSTSTFQNMENVAESKGELGKESEWSGREKRQRKAGRHTGTERHLNNTYTGQEKSPFQPRWPRNQGMAVTSGLFVCFLLHVLSPCFFQHCTLSTWKQRAALSFSSSTALMAVALLISYQQRPGPSVRLSNLPASLADSGWVHCFLSPTDRRRVG